MEDLDAGIQAQETVRQLFLAAAGRRGVTPDYVISKLKRLANAKRVQYFAHQGQVIDERTTKDNAIRIQAISLICDILGGKAPAKQELSGSVVILKPDNSVVKR